MSQSNPTLIEETRAAAQGAWRLLIGRRDAPGYFYLGLTGLVSSFIALVVAMAIALAASALGRTAAGPLSSFDLLMGNAVLYATLCGAAWITLRLTGKGDRFVPYLVVDNWINALLSTVLAVVGLIGVGADIVLFAAIVAGLAAKINNARLIIGMRIGQIALLFAGQIIGALVGLILLGLMIGPALA